MRENVKYIYICSSGHSGSTLLDLLIGSHSKVFSLGEIVHLSKNISLNTPCSCGKSIRSCEVWANVISVLSKKRGIDFLKDPYALNLGLPNPLVVRDQIHKKKTYQIKRQVLRAIRYAQLKFRWEFLKPFITTVEESIKNTFEVYDIVREVGKCQIAVDSSKSYLKAVGMYNHCPENFRIILLVRDGRGVFYSFAKRGFKRCDSLNAWKNHYNRAIPLLQKYVDRRHMLKIKYEDLVDNPQKQLENICKFTGLKFEKEMLNFRAHPHHVTDGNNMRFNKSTEITPDFSWKLKLSFKDLNYFEKKAGQLNRKLGYGA